MVQPISVAKGTTGRIELYGNRVVIKRTGVVARLLHRGSGEKEIWLSDITGIHLQKPGIVTFGYIQFGLRGPPDGDGGAISSLTDEYAVTYSRRHHGDFDALRDRIDDLREKKAARTQDRDAPAPDGPDSEESAPSRDPALDALREQYALGEITEDEYEERLQVLKGS